MMDQSTNETKLGESVTRMYNIPDSIKAKIGLNFHLKNNHPICIIKNVIIKYLKTLDKFKNIITYDDLSPFVSVKNNFDLLRIPLQHPSRSRSDTYYVDNETVLRTHTSAHQNELFERGYKSFIVTGDVYRKDEVDRYHYPVFHQMECVHIVDDDIDLEVDLKSTLSGLIEHLFPGKEYRFNSDYFPFTEPSFEMEVKFGDKWLEILGCGIIHTDILNTHGINKGWAFGFGLERIAMILFNIPDIRLFWTNDDKFTSQFKEGQLVEFKPYSKLDPIDRDISFWIPEVDIIDTEYCVWNNLNEFYQLVREVCGDNIENITLYDKFFHTKKLKYSHTFRLKFTPNVDSFNPTEFKKYVDSNMDVLRQKMPDLSVELR